MKNSSIKIFTVLLAFVEISSSQNNILDINLSPFFKVGRKVLNSFIEPQNFTRAFEINRKLKKIQPQFTEKTNFFCDVLGPGARSKSVPKSVHKLRPGDIDIVISLIRSLDF